MRALATTGLQVHPLCLGGNVFGWTADEAASFAVLDRYREAGGNFLDSADMYSSWAPGNEGGESETIIGRWIADRGVRDEMVIATKVGMHDDAGLGNLKPDTVARACDASLQRLGVERIDLYYVHRDDEDVPLQESLGAFDALVRAGKIAAVGVSNVSAERLRAMIAVTQQEGYTPISALQPRYNLLDREEFEGELQDLCVEHGIACVPYHGLAMGFLTGKYRRDSAAEDIGSPRAERAIEAYGTQERAWKTLDLVIEIAAAHDVAPAAVALAWVAAQEAVVAPIASARNVEQLEDLLAMADLQLSEDELAALSAA
jgi:aryl-alcohol dehydrogenase-like predicted oxidoreductase